MNLSDEDRALLTADEIATLEAEGAESGLAATSAEVESTTTTTAATNDEGDAANGDADDGSPKVEGEAKPAAEDLTAIIEEAEAAPAAAAAPKAFTIPEGDHDAKLADVKTRQSELAKTWAEGTTNDEEYATQSAALQDERDAIIRAQARDDALRTINEQNAAEAKAARDAEINTAVVALMKDSAKDGSALNYNVDKDAQAEFDQFFNAIESMPKHAGKSGAELATLAHRSVLVSRGLLLIAQPKPAQQDDPAKNPAARMQQAGPKTLSGLPNAGKVSLEDETAEMMHNMDAQQMEEWMANQPEHVQTRVVRAADRAAVRKH